MRVLFVSGELIAGSLALRLQQEGCDVKLFIKDKSRRDCFDNMIKKVSNWKKELSWVGKNGLIVFDDVGYGKEQEKLRLVGFRVVGGGVGGDILECDRVYGQKVLEQAGIFSLETHNFKSVTAAIKFVQKNRGEWVIKQNGHISSLTYVSQLSDGTDVIGVLESLKNKKQQKSFSISLQKKVYGVEIGIGRFFNGNDWVGPIELNVEHKSLCNGDIGPQTGEMGTLTWYVESSKLFDNTLSKIKPFLKKIDYRGDVDLNCIVQDQHIYPLEFTARFGCPAVQLQQELHVSSWADFLGALADGKPITLKYKKGFGIVVSIAVPPFPYKVEFNNQYTKGAGIFFKTALTKSEYKRVHFEEVLAKKNSRGDEEYFVAGSNGFILYVTGFGKTIKDAQKQAYRLVEKIVIPKMFYRTDIGSRFRKYDQEKLRAWGWI